VGVKRPLELCHLLCLPEPLREEQRHGRAAQQSPIQVEDNDWIDARFPHEWIISSCAHDRPAEERIPTAPSSDICPPGSRAQWFALSLVGSINTCKWGLFAFLVTVQLVAVHASSGAGSPRAWAAIAISSRERTVVDFMRLRSRVGRDQAFAVLRAYLDGRDARPGELLALARELRTGKAMRTHWRRCWREHAQPRGGL